MARKSKTREATRFERLVLLVVGCGGGALVLVYGLWLWFFTESSQARDITAVGAILFVGCTFLYRVRAPATNERFRKTGTQAGLDDPSA